MEADIRARMERKEYDSLTEAAELAQKLTEDLRAVSRDKHLMVHYSPTPNAERAAHGGQAAAERESRRRLSARMNHGFERVERLAGNIGYIDLREFSDPELGAETLAAAMTFVANTRALIIDLRHNGGGPPAMVALVCSYFFGSRPVHLNDLYWREGDRTEEYWTRPTVPGRRYEGKDVFLLTGRHTYSAAEEFAYNLKHLQRATIVGETSGGAAHHGEERKLAAGFSVYLPLPRAINPLTKTNWEGTGVKPDVAVPEEQAAQTAYVMALTGAMEQESDPDMRDTHKRLIEQQREELEGMKKYKKAD
jgi:C-terminal processing protease CtpA/Prc